MKYATREGVTGALSGPEIETWTPAKKEKKKHKKQNKDSTRNDPVAHHLDGSRSGNGTECKCECCYSRDNASITAKRQAKARTFWQPPNTGQR